MNNQTITKTYQNIEVHFRAEDGWVNATKLVKAYGKKLQNFWLAPGIKPMQTNKERTDASPKGTWVHPILANTIARWLDKDLAIWLGSNQLQLAVEVTPDTYMSLHTFGEHLGRKIVQPKSNHLTDMAKELTLKAGLEVKRPKELVISKNGNPYSRKANAYPLRFWNEALELLNKKKKVKKFPPPKPVVVVNSFVVAPGDDFEDCPF